MGRGVGAAAVMGQLRATARAYASAEMTPADVLTRMDSAVTRLEQAQITNDLDQNTYSHGVFETTPAAALDLL